MNKTRILLGGLVGGLLMVVIDGLINGVMLAKDFADAYQALGLPRENPAIPAYWISFDLIMGVAIAWLYAALRPRFGPGLRTAIYAGLLEWFMVHATLFSHLADRVFPPAPLLLAGAGELVAALVGASVAGWLYREP